MSPAAFSPTITARFSMRAERDESRDVVTVAALRQPGGEGHRHPRRELGREVDVGEPGRPHAAEEALASPCVSQMIELVTVAFDSTILCG